MAHSGEEIYGAISVLDYEIESRNISPTDRTLAIGKKNLAKLVETTLFYIKYQGLFSFCCYFFSIFFFFAKSVRNFGERRGG